MYFYTSPHLHIVYRKNRICQAHLSIVLKGEIVKNPVENKNYTKKNRPFLSDWAIDLMQGILFPFETVRIVIRQANE